MTIYTDGGCSGNPGPGGWAYVILNGQTELRRSGFSPDTTNNRMELTAVIKALQEAKSNGGNVSDISILTDSQYVKNGITQWIQNWLKNGWKTSAKKPVKNDDLWKPLHTLSLELKPDWHWVRGHAGNKYNEICDSMVQAEIRQLR